MENSSFVKPNNDDDDHDNNNLMITNDRYYEYQEDRENDDQDQNMTVLMKQKPGRGKIQIKPITNPTNRQVTYSKRRNGIIKKARELAVLCDAKISLIMVSHNNTRMHEYTSPNVTTKEMLDIYQKTTGTDLWRPQYERMQQTLRQLKEKNHELRRQIRQRMGYDLEDLSFNELSALEDDMSKAVDSIRATKYNKFKTQTVTSKKKVKSLEDRNLALFHAYQAKCEDLPYGLLEDDDVEGLGCESAMARANGASNLCAFRHGHGGREFDPYLVLHELRLG